MADQIAQKIISVALATRRSHPDAPALDVLDLAMQGHHGADLNMEADGQPFADWLDPPSDFARLLRDAFAPGLPADPFFGSGVDVWSAQLPGGQILAEAWRELVLEPFSARYGLWGQ
mgnify:CR=1 FL=1